MASFGELVLCLAAVFSAAGGAICIAKGNEKRFLDMGRQLLVAAALASMLVLVILVFVLVTHDYTVAYVRDYADRTMSLGFLVTAVWGGQQGSLLFWAILQTWFTAAAAFWTQKKETPLAPVAFGFLASLQVFFFLLVLFHSNPFELLGTVATHGVGLNPLLRNLYMVFHPPTLYLGFVGFSIPMAFAIAALVENKLDNGWLVDQRLWILFAWIFLSVGNILGMVWAYEELGWGGYWGWDPVENASLMPWFTATALMHSAMAEERRGVCRRWNILLILITFILIIFGTFLTRSGIIESVHAFAGATAGPFLLGVIVVVSIICLAFLFYRFRRLSSKCEIEPGSKEWLFAAGNWSFTFAFIFVLIATMWPVLSDVFIGEKVTVTPAFYNKWMVPVGLLILGLIGVCTMTSWRKTAMSSKNSKLLITAILAGVAALIISAFFGAYKPELGGAMSVAPAISVGLLVMLAVGLFGSIRQTILAGKQPSGYVVVNGRKFGGQLVHLSVILLFVGFTGSAFTVEKQGLMEPGQHFSLSGYTIEFMGLRGDANFEREATFADLKVTGSHGDFGVLSPAKFFYFSHPKQPTSEVVIKTSLTEDLFLILGETEPSTGRAIIRAVVNPLVIWIWLGGFLLVIGSLVAMMPRGWFIRLLEMKKETQKMILAPAGFMFFTTLFLIIIGSAFNFPTALAALGGIILILLPFVFASALRKILSIKEQQ